MRIPEGQVFGPVARSELDRWLSEGRISAECLLRADGDSDWHPATESYGALAPPSQGYGSSLLDNSRHAAPRTHGPVVPGAAAYSMEPARAYLAPHRGGLILTFGILAWVFSCPIFGLMAWMMGASDLREMRHGRMDNSGIALTQAGHILGMINTLLWIVLFAVVLFVFVLAAVSGALR
jgi:hypothetical protein